MLKPLVPWKCIDCGTKIDINSKQGVNYIHCNCTFVQPVRVGKLKIKEDGIEGAAFGGHKKRFPVASGADQVSKARRGLVN